MAAMAQQDCGQCGLQLQRLLGRDRQQGRTAVESVAWPGGKETARDAEGAERGVGEGAGGFAWCGSRGPAATAPAITAEARAFSRDNPVPATFVSRRLLNKTGSEKETWHIDFDLSGCGPRLCRRRFLWDLRQQRFWAHVDQIIALLGASHTTEVRGKTLREVLRDDVVAGARRRIRCSN